MATNNITAPVRPAKTVDWNAVVSAYRSAASERDAASPNDWNDATQESAWEKLVDRAGKALRAVTACPVTTLTQLAEKCALVKAEYPDASHLDGDDCEAIIADVQRIASGDAISTDGENPALVAAFEQYRAAARVLRNDPEVQLPEGESDKLFAVMDVADDALNAEPACTVSGAIMKLRRAFACGAQEAWSDFAVFDDRPQAFAEGLAVADLYNRMFWGAIEDLQRIAIDQHAVRLANGGDAWDRALAGLQAAQAAVDAIPLSEDEGAWNAADSKRSDAAFALATTPAPDRAALLVKAEQLFGEAADNGEWGPTWHPEMIASYMADVRRLAAMEG